MISGTDAREYRSPVQKLTRFFERSRDNWKSKHHAVKLQCRKLENQVRAVEKSRSHWKEQAKEQTQRVRDLERQLEQLKRFRR